MYLVPGPPEPMSDQFYVLLVDKCGNDLKSTGTCMNLSKPEMEGLFSDTLMSKDEHKVLQVNHPWEAG